MNIEFLDFTMEDNSEVTKMIMELYKEDDSGPEVTLDKINNTFNELTNKKERGRIIVFKESKATIGYGIIIFFWSNQYGGDIVVFDELYIKESWRNKGIATLYFEHIFNEYKDRAKSFKLEVTSSNENAKKLYMRLGFKLAKDLAMVK